MTNHAKKLLSDALALPVRERAELASRLLGSLDDEEPEIDAAEWSAAWAAEIERRLRAVDEVPDPAAPIEAALERIFRR